MQIPLRMTFRGLAGADWLEAEIARRVAQLERYYPAITGGRVLVQLDHRRHQTGNRFHIRVDLAVPGGVVVASHESSLHASLRDLGTESSSKQSDINRERTRAVVAVRRTFDVVRRRLQDFARRQRGAVKTHAPRRRSAATPGA
ncbi:MAG TPA: HPF/RaiA family ribosome-associated protein [Vicinamibacterales bacterium]|nr:HPF/RaiA family ribosome-associated protein [Vicinamibacterales bacterium]